MENLRVEYVPVRDLTPYKKNARKHGTEDIDAICESIREFGFLDPVGVWSDDLIIVEGHGRILAAKKLGLEKVPVIRLDNLTEEQRRAYALAHNRTAELSVWDLVLRDEELKEIETIDMSSFGFEIPDDEETPPEMKEDEFTGELPENATAKYGDVYLLGNHRLMCGDSVNVDDIKILMDGKRADLVLTDPPYGVKAVENSGHVDGKKAGNQIARDNSYIPIIGDDTTETAQKNYELSKEFSENQIIFGGNYFSEFLPVSRCWLVWDKEVAGTFADGELAWTSFDKNLKIYRHMWSGMRRAGDRKTEGRTRIHPTQKPVGLLGKIIDDFTEVGALIADFFGGSGSTLIACEQTGRTCYMMELEPRYIDLIIARWEQYTGKKAVKV